MSKEQVAMEVTTLLEDSRAESALGDAALRTRNIAVSRAAGSLMSLIRSDPENVNFAVEVGGIEALVTALRQRPNSVEVQNKATGTLGILASCYENQTQAGNAGGIEVIVSALRDHPSSEAVQGHAAEALGCLVAQHPKNQLLAKAAGGIEAVLVALEQHPQSEALQAKALVALGSLVMESHQSQRRAQKARGIELALAAMRQHPRSEAVQEHAVDALGHLVAHNPENLMWSREVGAVQAVVAVLKQMQASEAVQAKALGTLKKLIMDSNDNQRLAGGAGAVEAVARAFRAHIEKESIQIPASEALCHLVAHNEAIQDLARQEGLIEVVMQALKRYPGRESVLVKLLITLEHLVARNAESQRRAIDVGGRGILTDMLNSNSDNEWIQETAVGVLMHLTALGCETQAQAENAETLKALITVLRQHTCNMAMQTNAKLALRSLVLSSQETMGAAVQRGGIEEVVSALQQLPEAEERQPRASVAAEHCEYQVVARRAGLIEALVNALGQAPAKARRPKGRLPSVLAPAPQVNMLNALGDLVAYNGESQRVAGEAGAIEAVIFVLREHAENEAVQEHALQAFLDLIVGNAANQRRAKLAGADSALNQTVLAHQQHPHAMLAAKAALEALCWGENFATKISATDFGKRHQKCHPIPDAAQRGITLAQLRELAEFIKDSLEKYDIVRSPRASQTYGRSVTWDGLSMYDVRDLFVMPLTHKTSCSYVELVAGGRQQPMWMVSHWWGTPFDFTARMLGFHAKSRYTTGAPAVTYWLCTTANNQHDLHELDDEDVLRSPFARAMLSQGCMGTVFLCDPEVTALMRIWCVLETQITQQLRCGVLSSRTDKRYFMDIVAPVAHQRVGDEDVTVAMTMLQDAVGGSWNEVSDTEGVFFPLDVARFGVAVDILRAECSEEADRHQILNYITRGVSSTGAPPEAHPNYDRLNDFVHTVFTSAELYRLASEQPDGCVEAVAKLLEMKADVNSFVRRGNTPLFAAAGADPVAPSATNATQQRGLISMLLCARADTNHANAEMKTVLDASSALPDEARGLLLQHGAKTYQDVAPLLELTANDQLAHILAAGFESEGQAFVGGDAGTRLSLAAERSLQAAATAVLKLYHWAPCRIGIQTNARRHQAALARERANSVRLALASAGCLNTPVVYFGPQRALLSLRVTIIPQAASPHHARGDSKLSLSAPECPVPGGSRDWGGDRRRKEAPIRFPTSSKKAQGPRPESAVSGAKKVAWTKPPTPGPLEDSVDAISTPKRQGSQGQLQRFSTTLSTGSGGSSSFTSAWSTPVLNSMSSLRSVANLPSSSGSGSGSGCVPPPTDEPPPLPWEDWRPSGLGGLQPDRPGAARTLSSSAVEQQGGQAASPNGASSAPRSQKRGHIFSTPNPLRSVQRSLRRAFSVSDLNH